MHGGQSCGAGASLSTLLRRVPLSQQGEDRGRTNPTRPQALMEWEQDDRPRKASPRHQGGDCRRGLKCMSPACDDRAQNFHFAVQASASFTMSGRFIVPARIALSKLRFT